MSQTQAKGERIMRKKIDILKNNDKKNWDDLRLIEEFYKFLQGDAPDEISFSRGYQPKLSHKKAFSIIYYLQEHFPVLPDHIEQCWNCGGLFDTNCSGLYWESKFRHYCDSCMHLVPENYDRGKM